MVTVTTAAVTEIMEEIRINPNRRGANGRFVRAPVFFLCGVSGTSEILVDRRSWDVVI
jgi:hypothetical protein